LQEGEQGNHGNGGDFDSWNVRELSGETSERARKRAAEMDGAVECREHVRHVFPDDDPDRAGAAAGGEPVAPTDDEAGEIADGQPREIVLAAAFGDGGAELGDLKSADQGVESADEPNGEEEPMIGKARGDVAGCVYDAGGDGVAYGDSDTETHAENLEKFALFLVGISGARGEVGGERVRGRRQCAISWKMCAGAIIRL